MKILMVNKFLFPNGGSETYIFNLGDYLTANGHKVEYFGMDHEMRTVGNSANMYVSNMDFHTHGLQKFLYPFKIIYSIEARKKIKHVLEVYQPDVIHLNNFNFQLTPSILYEINAYAQKKSQYVPVVYTAHDYQLICPNHMMNIPSAKINCEKCLNGNYSNCVKHRCIHNSLTKSFFGAMEGFLYRKLNTYKYIDHVICPSFFIEGKLANHPSLNGKTVTLHNFNIESEMYDQKKDNYVLYFGRFSEEKGIKTLLQVCAALPEIPFVFAGNGPLLTLLSGLPNVRCVGFLSGGPLKDLIRKARFSIYPSEWYENCPFSVMESQILGTPVIGARIGGIPELIEEGITGELFTSGDPDALKEKVERLWNDQETLKHYTKNCLNKKYMTLSEYCGKLIEIYHS